MARRRRCRSTGRCWRCWRAWGGRRAIRCCSGSAIDQSTFFRESKGAHRGNERKEHGWGAIDVKRIAVGGVDLTRQFTVDDTLGTVKLPRPVAAGASVDVDIEFTVKLPKVFARTGYHDDFLAVAQWFPKIGVFDCEPGPYGGAGCRWRAHQHHLNSEFFADYGVYDVELDVPASARVGATGVLVDERVAGPPDRSAACSTRASWTRRTSTTSSPP